MTEQEKRYRESISALRARGRALLRREAHWRLAMQIVGILGGVTLTGVCELALNNDALSDVFKGQLQALWAVGLITAFAAGALLVFFDQSAPDILADADTALSAARRTSEENLAATRLEITRLRSIADGAADQARLAQNAIAETLSEIEDLAHANRRFKTLYSMTRSALLEGIETVALTGPPSQDEMKSLSGTILDIFCLFPNTLFGFDEEYWSLSVLGPELQSDGVERLVCMSTRRSSRRSEDGAHRAWEKHEGCAGLAWGQSKEIVIEDVLQGNWPEVLKINENNRRDRDHERHRSLASVPIIVGSKVAGMVSATSSFPERFVNGRAESEDEFELDSVEPLRAIASNLAILFALTHIGDSKSGAVE